MEWQIHVLLCTYGSIYQIYLLLGKYFLKNIQVSCIFWWTVLRFLKTYHIWRKSIQIKVNLFHYFIIILMESQMGLVKSNSNSNNLWKFIWKGNLLILYMAINELSHIKAYFLQTGGATGGSTPLLCWPKINCGGQRCNNL